MWPDFWIVYLLKLLMCSKYNYINVKSIYNKYRSDISNIQIEKNVYFIILSKSFLLKIVKRFSNSYIWIK